MSTYATGDVPILCYRSTGRCARRCNVTNHHQPHVSVTIEPITLHDIAAKFVHSEGVSWLAILHGTTEGEAIKYNNAIRKLNFDLFA